VKKGNGASRIAFYGSANIPQFLEGLDVEGQGETCRNELFSAYRKATQAGSWIRIAEDRARW
jgi:hypothetical protein